MAIAFDSSNNSTVTSTSLTFAHTCTGSNLVLFVYVIYGTADNITSVTYNGVAMTQIAKIQRPVGSRYTYLYALLNPTTGSNNVIISASVSDYIGSVSASYTGVKQSGLPDSFLASTYTSQTNFAANLTTIADNCWIAGLGYGTTVTAGSGTFLRQAGPDVSNAFFDTNGIVHPAGSYTMNVATPSSNGTTIFASFAPAVANTSLGFFNLV